MLAVYMQRLSKMFMESFQMQNQNGIFMLLFWLLPSMSHHIALNIKLDSLPDATVLFSPVLGPALHPVAHQGPLMNVLFIYVLKLDAL